MYKNSPETDADQLIAYFGYGSLVNLNTLQTGYVSAHPAVLKGWRRHWQARGNSGEQAGAMAVNSAEKQKWTNAIQKAGFGDSVTTHDLALLSAHRDEQFSIGGMLVIDQAKNLPALDERERLYDRVIVDKKDIEIESDVLEQIEDQNLFVYVGQVAPPGQPPLLQSYLDTVMAGFLEAHGEGGVADFVSSTTGFSREIILDRTSPIYPRSVAIDREIAAYFDTILLDAGVRYA